MEKIITWLIIVSVIILPITTLPDLPQNWAFWLDNIEAAISIVFTAEYLHGFYRAKNKIQYMKSFDAVINLISIMPFWVTLGLVSIGWDATALRVLRIFRIVRLMRINRYIVAMERLARAFSYIKDEAVVFGVATIVLIYLSAVGVYFFENQAQPEIYRSAFESLWWAIITLTTVGYGDMYPVTAGGRAFTFVILIVGLAIIAVPTGLFVDALARVHREERRKEEEDQLQKQQEGSGESETAD